jgi:hypothetical protein
VILIGYFLVAMYEEFRGSMTKRAQATAA